MLLLLLLLLLLWMCALGPPDCAVQQVQGQQGQAGQAEEPWAAAGPAGCGEGAAGRHGGKDHITEVSRSGSRVQGSGFRVEDS
jgi:hypothetical protein